MWGKKYFPVINSHEQNTPYIKLSPLSHQIIISYSSFLLPPKSEMLFCCFHCYVKFKKERVHNSIHSSVFLAFPRTPLYVICNGHPHLVFHLPYKHCLGKVHCNVFRTCQDLHDTQISIYWLVDLCDWS